MTEFCDTKPGERGNTLAAFSRPRDIPRRGRSGARPGGRTERRFVATSGALLAVSLLMFAISAKAAPPAAPTEEAAPTAAASNGTRCDTPRESVYTLIYWLQDDSRSPARAASCLDRSRLESPEIESRALAEKLKKVLDVRGLEVVFEDIPDDADWTNEDGKSRYALFAGPFGGAVALEKKDGQWLFTAETVAKIPGLYGESFPLGMEDIIDALPSWMRGTFAGFEVWQLVGVFLLLFLALLLQKIVVWLISTYLHRLVGRLQVSWVAAAVKRSSKPVGGLVVALVFSVGFPVLHFGVRVNRFAFVAIRVLAAFSAVWLAYRLVDVLTEWLAEKAEKSDTKLDDQLVPLLRKTLKLFFAIVGGIFLLQNMNVDVGSLLAGLGLGGLAFALAAKDTIANFFGSLMIFIDKPFQIGDAIKLGDVEGTVEEVGFRTSRIRTPHNSLITLPNAKVTENAVDNLGARLYRRYKTTLGLKYDTPAEKIQAFCEGVRGIIQALPGMRKDFFIVEFAEYGANSLDIMLYCFMTAPTMGEELRTRTQLNLQILRLAKEMGVEFAFPTRTLHVFNNQGPEPVTPFEESAKLAAVIEAFGPGGSEHRPEGVALGVCHDAGSAPRREDEQQD